VELGEQRLGALPADGRHEREGRRVHDGGWRPGRGAVGDRELPKTVVIALLERLHARFGFKGIADTLATEPGPELAPEQLAQHELMPFPILDACLHLYASEKLSPEEVAVALTSIFPDLPPDALAAHARRFARLFTQSIFKWVQAPLALHVGSLELDRERALQIPVVQKNEW